MTFKPIAKRSSVPSNLTLRVSEEEYHRIKRVAKDAGISMTEFTRQCVFYALDHMEDEK